MRFGVYIPLSGEYDIRSLAALAVEVEEAGWDGLFVWDNLAATFDGSGRVADTTVALSVIAAATTRVRFGALVTPVPRRRPWKLAKECATLDVLSEGRLVLGVGSGGRWDFLPFGEGDVGPARGRALDEGLEVIDRLWREQDVGFSGTEFRLEYATLAPPPVQRPRIPIWVGGYWPGVRPFARAARWDGCAPVRAGTFFEQLTPAELADCRACVAGQRNAPGDFDMIFFHTRTARERDAVAHYADAGATWWLESALPELETMAEFRRRIRSGPPG